MKNQHCKIPASSIKHLKTTNTITRNQALQTPNTITPNQALQPPT